MNKKNNKGLTLLELLVALAILTTVIFIGYKIIDKSTIAIKEQSETNKGQLTMNNMNKYLTKDLEQATSIKLLLEGRTIADTRENKEEKVEKDVLKEAYSKEIKPQIDDLVDGKYSNNLNYKYIIRDGYDKEDSKKYIEYDVDIERKDNRVIFSINREDQNGVSIDIVNNDTLKENEVPFNIIGNSPYTITMGYNEGDDFQKYQFEVASRYFISEGTDSDEEDEVDPPKPPEITIQDGYNAIGFWTSDKSKCTEENSEGNLYTWIMGSGKYGWQNNSHIEQFNIEAYNAINSNNANAGKSASKIGYNLDDLGKYGAEIKDQKLSIKPNQTTNIYIYISKYTKLKELKDLNGTIIGLKKINNDIYRKKPDVSEGLHTELGLIEGGEEGSLYKCTLSNNNKKIFRVTGKLSINKSKVDSGFAIILIEDKNYE